MSRAFEAQFAEGVDIVLDYLWGPGARALLIAAAKALDDGRVMRFVQIGSIGGAEIGLPGAVLRSTAITLMGSGIGSVALPRLLECVKAVLNAAASGALRVDAKAVPLAVERALGRQRQQTAHGVRHALKFKVPAHRSQRKSARRSRTPRPRR